VADECIFCKIVKGELPTSKVAEDDRTLAILDIMPVNPGHTLVIPKTHAKDLADLPKGVGGALFMMAERVAAAQREGLSAEGVNLFLADGRVAGQVVLHVHLHVVPRYDGDGFGLSFPAGYGVKPPREELEATAAKLRGSLPR